MKRLKQGAAALTGVLLLLSGCSGGVDEYQCVHPETGTLVQQLVEGTGTVSYREEYSVIPTVSAKILSCSIEEGDTVTAGQVLYVLDSGALEDQITQARLSLNSAQASYAQAVDACTDLTVPAHASGTVTEVYVHVGDYVNTGTAIASLVDSANLTLTVPFAAEDAADMAPGNTAAITFPGQAGTVTGSVERVYDTPTALSGGREGVYVEFAFRNPGAVLSGTAALASVGGAFSVRSGIMALGLESMMMMGAFFGVLGSYFTGSVLFGFLLGMVGGMVIGLFHGILSVRYKVNQVISGIGLNLLALAVTTLLMQLIWSNKGSTPQVASISTTLDFFAPIPVIGPILAQQSVSFLVMVAVVIVGWIVLFKTRFGLRLRMVGENPKAAATMGLRVHGIKYCGVLICGALAGVGGAYLSLDQLDMFVRNMTAGRGYIAVAIAILGRYNPAQIVPCALLFGFCDAVQIYLQGEAFPPQIVQMLPYIVTLLVLAFGVKHIKPPAGVGKYDDE